MTKFVASIIQQPSGLWQLKVQGRTFDPQSDYAVCMAVLSAEIALCEHDYIHSKMANNYQQALLQTEIADGNEKH